MRTYDMRTIDTIILHHTAGNMGGAAIRRMHRSWGWSDIFYHFVVERDGGIFTGRPLSRPATQRRPTAVEVAVVGNFVNEPLLSRQRRQVVQLLEILGQRFSIVNWHNHKEVAATLCPGQLCVRLLRGEVTW